MKKNELVAQILKFVKEKGGSPKHYYVGTSSDPGTKMFTMHLVQPLGGIYKYIAADSFEEAVAAKTDLIENHGFDGRDSRESPKATYLYVYKKTAGSKQEL